MKYERDRVIFPFLRFLDVVEGWYTYICTDTDTDIYTHTHAHPHAHRHTYMHTHNYPWPLILRLKQPNRSQPSESAPHCSTIHDG